MGLGALAVAAMPAAPWMANEFWRMRLEASRLRAGLREARAEVVHLNATLAAMREVLALARENVRIGHGADMISGLLHAELAAMRQEVRRLAAESPPPLRAVAGGEGRTPAPH